MARHLPLPAVVAGLSVAHQEAVWLPQARFWARSLVGWPLALPQAAVALVVLAAWAVTFPLACPLLIAAHVWLTYAVEHLHQ